MKLDEIPQNGLGCRDRNHHWQQEWTLETELQGQVERVCSCTRCTTTRTELIDTNTGDTLSRRYAYAFGFVNLAPPGTRWGRGDYRKENVRRALAPKPKAK